MSERPRVVHVITRLVAGGAQENTILSCAGLLKRGYDVSLITGPEAGPEGSLLERAKAAGIPVIIQKSLRRNPRVLLDLFTVISLARRFRRERPAIVHTHSSKAGIIGRLAAWLAGVPIILHTNHGLPFHRRQWWIVNRAWRLLEKLVAPMTCKFICVGETMKRDSIEAGLGPPERHEVVYSGMDIPTFEHYAASRADLRPRFGFGNDEPVVGWVGRFVKQKGARDLPEILERILKANHKAKVHLVGDGPLRPAIEDNLEEREFSERVLYAGRVAPEMVSSYMSAMDVLILTSYWEGLPRVAVQGALAGLPVVAYEVEGASEVIRSGETGHLVPSGDKGALADKVIEVLGRPDRGRSMGEKGRRFVGDRFDSTKMVDALAKLYEELL